MSSVLNHLVSFYFFRSSSAFYEVNTNFFPHNNRKINFLTLLECTWYLLQITVLPPNYPILRTLIIIFERPCFHCQRHKWQLTYNKDILTHTCRKSISSRKKIHFLLKIPFRLRWIILWLCNYIIKSFQRTRRLSNKTDNLD